MVLGPLAVTLDATQTLFHAPRLVYIYREVLARHHVELPSEDLESTLREVWNQLACRADPRRDRFASHPQGAQGWWRDYLRRLCELEGAPEPSPFAAAELFHRFARADSWEVFADVPPILSALRERGIRLGIISNWDERLPRLLDDLDLRKYFDAVVYSSELGCEKPDPRIFSHCLRHLQAPPERTLHIGDGRLEDLDGARGAGMKAVRIDRRNGETLYDILRPVLGNLAPPDGVANSHARG